MKTKCLQSSRPREAQAAAYSSARFEAGVGACLSMRLLAVALTLVFLLSGCSPAPIDRFPTLPTASTLMPSPTTRPTVNPEDPEPAVLRVAGPFTAEAAEALRQLYLNLESGMLVRKDGETIGDRFKPGGVVPDDDSLQIRFEPVTMEQMMDGGIYRAMAESGTLPDVFATGDVGSLLKLGAIADMTPVLAGIDSKAASRMPVFAMDALHQDDRYWGVPYLATVPLLLVNTGLASQLQAALPTNRMSIADMTDLLIRTRQTLQSLSLPDPTPTPEQSGQTGDDPIPSPAADNPYLSVSAIADLRPFLTVWPSSVDDSLGYAAYQNGVFRFESGAVANSLKLLRALDRPQMTPAESMAKAGLLDMSEARSLFRNQKTVFLSEDSCRLQEWSLQSQVQVRALDMPIGNLSEALKQATGTWPASFPTPTAVPTMPVPSPSATDEPETRQAFTLSAYCVSATTAHPELAGQLAYFLAQDPDALLLQNQYVRYEGFLPLSHDTDVWDNLVGSQSSNTILSPQPILSPYLVRLRRGYANPSILVPGFRQVIEGTLQSPERFQPGASTSATVLAALSKTALERLKEARK